MIWKLKNIRFLVMFGNNGLNDEANVQMRVPSILTETNVK